MSSTENHPSTPDGSRPTDDRAPGPGGRIATALRALRRSGRSRRAIGCAALSAVAAGGLGAAAGIGGAGSASAAAGWEWFKTDLHVHSVLSADAVPDLGIISHEARADGFDALFLTDHNAGSSFEISGLSANHMVLEDTLRRWEPGTAGAITGSANALVTTPVRTGTHALRLSATSSSAGEAFVSTKRGPNLRSGNAVVTFSVQAKRIDAGGGLYVSASLGGDATVDPPVGYTTQAGVVSPGKHTIFVWYLGAAPPLSFNPGGSMITTSLATSGACDRAFALNVWLTCTIRLNDALSRMPAADRPSDTNAWSQLKIGAVAANGTVDGYFDGYSIDASAPIAPADEFVHVNTLLAQHSTADFKILPGVEMGINKHAQRFHFPLTNPTQFTAYQNGIDGILPAQQAGYPAQLNHPGEPGGVTDQEAIDNDAHGADTMEVRQTQMIADWDAILAKGVPLVGTWGSDNHNGTWSNSSQVTHIYAPALTHDALTRSMFEGRLALGTGVGPLMSLNLDPASADPHPARYPVHVSNAAASATAHLTIGGTIAAGSSLVWRANGAILATEALAAAYDGTRSVPLNGSTSYVRAEVLNAAGTRTGMSEAIVFVDVPGLPAGMRFGVHGIAIPSGHDYTRIVTKGITASGWNATARTLSMTLANPAGSLVEARVETGALPPSGVAVAGASVAKAPSREAFDAATGSSWWFDGSSNLLLIKALQGSGDTAVVANFGAADTQAPSAPTGLGATPASPSRVDLGWNAATDNLGVAGYTVYRNGTAIGSVEAPATTYSDTTAAPATAYSYRVDAVDAAGNRSAKSSAASATTPGLSVMTATPDADTYTTSSAPASNYGAATLLRADVSPAIRSFLRFTVGGLAGPVTKATLRIYAPNAHAVGYDVHGVADNAWAEGAITHETAPAVGAKVGASGAFAAGTWTSVDVTPLISGNGTFSMALSTTSNTAMALQSREAANAPRLVVEASTGPIPDTQPPSVPTGLTAGAMSGSRIDLAWTASTDNIAVSGYAIYRDGAQVASVDGATTSWQDTTVAPATGYSYQVDAVDAAGNRSARSAAAGATTPGGTTGVSTAVVADAYTSSGAASTNYGTAPTLRADASPLIRSWLRFTVSGADGPVTRATLRIHAGSAQSTGYELFRVADTAWSETGITHATAPAVGAHLGASGPVAAGSWTEVDVTPYVTGNGTYGFALTTTSSTAMSLSSRESANDPQLVLETGGGGGDTQEPSAPTGLTAAAVSHWIDLSWSASSDDVGVTGYTIYRDGAPLATVDGLTTSYSDTTVHDGATYTYEVDASDAAGNRSARSTGASATANAETATVTVRPAADAYTSADAPGTNYGGSTILRADASPLIRTWLRFTVTGLEGPATSATLRIYANSTSGAGYDALRVADTVWSETGITHASAPAVGTKIGSSGAVAAGAWTTVDVTPYVTGNGTYGIALTTPSSTALSLASRESANPPELVVEG